MEPSSAALDAILHYRYAALFAWVLASQCGLPVPATPVLALAGALVAGGRLRLGPTLAAAVLACLVADSLWYALGRTRGNGVLRVLCRISLEPLACVRKAADLLARHGASFLLVAKFLPGVGLMAAPSAGQARMRFDRFTAFTAGGGVAWASAYVSLGRLFGPALSSSNALRVPVGQAAAIAAACAVGFVARKLVARRRLRAKGPARGMSVPELGARLARGVGPWIVDLRGRGYLAQDRRSLPGAVQLTPDELLAQADTMPRDREIVVACDCPGDVSSRLVAQQLRSMGFARALSLEGGFAAWRDAGLPLVPAEDPLDRPRGGRLPDAPRETPRDVTTPRSRRA